MNRAALLVFANVIGSDDSETVNLISQLLLSQCKLMGKWLVSVTIQTPYVKSASEPDALPVGPVQNRYNTLFLLDMFRQPDST